MHQFSIYPLVFSFKCFSTITWYFSVPNLLFFLLVGLIVILTFTSLHLLFSGLICFILGLDFLTVIYVTAAAITTGSVLTIALTFLVSLYCVLTFFASMHASSTPSSLLQQRQDLSAAQLKNLVATTSAAPAPGDVKSN